MKHSYVTWFGETFCVECFLEKTGDATCHPGRCPGCCRAVEECKSYDECGTYYWQRKYFKQLYFYEEP